jgi:hypothetical protein
MVVTLADIDELNSLNPVVSDITTCDEPDTTPSVFNLFLIVVIMDDVNEFNEPVLTSRLPTLSSILSVVVATDDDKLPIEEFNDELIVPIELLKLLVVVATDDDNPPILESILELIVPIELLKLLVVVATDDDNPPILESILELNVEYPVVPVIEICELPETNVGLLIILE